MTTKVTNGLLNSNHAKVLLQTVSVAGLTNVDLLSGFSTEYDHYEIEFSVIPSTDGQQLRMLFSLDGGATWLNSYRTSGTNSVTDVSIATGGCSNSAAARRAGTVDLFRNGAAAFANFLWKSCGITTATGGSQENVSGGGIPLTVGTVNGIRLFFSSGTFANGYVSIYGIRK